MCDRPVRPLPSHSARGAENNAGCRCAWPLRLRPAGCAAVRRRYGLSGHRSEDRRLRSPRAGLRSGTGHRYRVCDSRLLSSTAEGDAGAPRSGQPTDGTTRLFLSEHCSGHLAPRVAPPPVLADISLSGLSGLCLIILAALAPKDLQEFYPVVTIPRSLISGYGCMVAARRSFLRVLDWAATMGSARAHRGNLL